MFIPLGTNLQGAHRPLVVPCLVAVNLVIAFGSALLARRGNLDLGALLEFGALPWRGMRWWQPISYQFLHDPNSFTHVLGNMIFLWAFGSVVEARLGRLGFTALYLVGGALAGLLQVAISGGSAIGASGSVSVVAGAFLALHPRGIVHGFWLLPPMRVAMRASWLLGLYAAIDFVNTLLDVSGLRYSRVGTIAHLSGLLFGLVVALFLLGTGILPRNDFDLFFLLKQWRRRRELRSAADAFGVSGAGGAVARRVARGSAPEESERHRTLRMTIAAAHRERDYVLAAQLYAELLGENREATLPAEIQLDVATEFARAENHAFAAQAYRRFLERFRSHPASDDARLLLAAIEVRRLGDKRAALLTLEPFREQTLDGARAELLATLRAECAAETQR